jgi:ribosome-associated heat shock protein Hsp15
MTWEATSRIRLDRWLWAARWFKTRALAARAITGGKVKVNGERPKRSRLIAVGDEVSIRRGPFEYHVVVQGLSETRGPADEARRLYQETASSVQARQVLARQLASQPRIIYRGKGRPTKKDRRAIERWERLEGR